MKNKTVKVLTEKERNELSKDQFLKIERDFHDKYAQHLNWEEDVTDSFSYERDEYGAPVEIYFKNLLGNVKNKKILDIGSGQGNTALNLARQGAIVTSIDIAPKLIEGCRHRAKISSLDVDFRVMNACELDFENETFDIVVGFRVIHHLPDLEKFFVESHRCLKKNGFLLVTEPQKYNPFVEFGRRFIKNSEDSRTPTEHPLVPRDIKLLKQIFGNIEKREFEFLKVMSLVLVKNRFMYKTSLKFFGAIDNILWHIPLFRPLYWQVVLKALKK